jgi:hypothetical protein
MLNIAAAISAMLFVATVVLWIGGLHQSHWLTHDTAGNRHLGAGQFADGLALYYVPPGPQQWIDRGWSLWGTPYRRTDEYVRSTSSFAGFRLARTAINPGDIYLVFPWWFLLALFAAGPVARIIGFVRNRKHRPPGVCRYCGYDLRATPGRCPECGREVLQSEEGVTISPFRWPGVRGLASGIRAGDSPALFKIAAISSEVAIY